MERHDFRLVARHGAGFLHVVVVQMWSLISFVVCGTVTCMRKNNEEYHCPLKGLQYENCFFDTSLTRRNQTFIVAEG